MFSLVKLNVFGWICQNVFVFPSIVGHVGCFSFLMFYNRHLYLQKAFHLVTVHELSGF